MNIVVLTGGISHERDVSLRSGRRLTDALERAGHSVTLLDTDAAAIDGLQQHRPDAVFPALHGASGEDGTLLGLIEALGIPYVGSAPLAARLAWSKPLARDRVAAAGVPVAPALSLSRESVRELGAKDLLEIVAEKLGLPLVIKPAHGGSAQGVSIVRDVGQLPAALVEAFSYSDSALCERFIEGTEFAVSIVQREGVAVALPAVEIEPLSGFYDFEARYNAGETRFYAPARLSESDAGELNALALRAHDALGLRHYSRIDLMRDTGGGWWFLEANVIPGMTETSLLPLAIEAAGLSTAEVYAALVSEALS